MHRFEALVAEQGKLQTKIFDVFPLNSSFKFLGITFIINKHISYTHAFTVRGLPTFPYTPAKVECGYVDRHGILHWEDFSLEELQLIKEGKPASSVLSMG